MKKSLKPLVILDFGTPRSRQLVRLLREKQVYSLIVPASVSTDALRNLDPAGLILCDADQYRSEQPPLQPGIITLGRPVLALGGAVRHFIQLQADTAKEATPDYGPSQKVNEKLFGPTQDHCDKDTDTEAEYPLILVRQDEAFHVLIQNFESLDDETAGTLLENFAKIYCQAPPWTMDRFLPVALEEIRRLVGSRKVLCGLSGGVDSTVVAALIHQAIGDQLTCVLVDTGLLRKGEADLVKELFDKAFKIKLIAVNAEDRFLHALQGISEPEEKRKIIGALFIDIFEEEAKKLGHMDFLAQGTLYPDIIESLVTGSGDAVSVKSHHNVGGLPERMQIQLLEPVRDLFKDEVRALGRELKLPEILVGRHPFPGPGLGVRCIGAITRERLDTLREADAIFIEEIRAAGLYDQIWQALVCLLPVKSVGIKNGKRVWEEVCTLRAVHSVDAMTAQPVPIPDDILQKITLRICEEIPHISRVLLDISPKPPATIEWE
ncbi:MAG: glutamine-hydrolyzing GMP synthase [Candidatus Hydrogenedens sp.]|jgi:GMP synthase (glutamine-hydrolysing)|nr:glutamine-hydrolyzing GMP synthase [Candidatus Hydrogenedens sp.]